MSDPPPFPPPSLPRFAHLRLNSLPEDEQLEGGVGGGVWGRGRGDVGDGDLEKSLMQNEFDNGGEEEGWEEDNSIRSNSITF